MASVDRYRPPTPNDIVPWEKAQTLPGRTYRVEARSVVVLYTRC